jgi:membrane-associated phospholipid phosphatase
VKSYLKSYGKLFNLSIIAGIAITISLVYHFTFGKTTAFLLINQLHHPISDQFFKYYTNFGDGLIWVLVVIYSYFYAKNKVSLVVTNFALSSLFAVILKKLIFPMAMRPSVLLQQGYQLHIVEDLKIHSSNSFPSGHTLTAFAVAFTMVMLIKKNNQLKYLFLVMAVMVGYSRVYLAQHYPIDAIFGAIVGIFSTYLSLYLHYFIKQFFKKRKRNLSVELS